MADNQYSKEINIYKTKLRFIIPINNFHIPKKLFQSFKKSQYTYKINSNLEEVIIKCQQIIRDEEETWINDTILHTYSELHKIKKCHSVECYEGRSLVGGLYGVHLGSCFFGESMFSVLPNTSKYCLLYLIAILKKNLFSLLDSQFYNKHLLQFGAFEISNESYLKILKRGLRMNCKFSFIDDFQEALSLLQSTNHKS